MTDLARCQQEAQSALAAWLEAWDIGAFQGWVDWTIEQDYIALEVRNVAVCKLPQDDLAGGIVSRLQAQRSAREGQGAGELSAGTADHARPSAV